MISYFIPTARLVIGLLLAGRLMALCNAAEWQAGFASRVITPKKPIPLVGYASRTNAFTEVDQEIRAQALALADGQGSRALLLTADICTLSPAVAEPVCEELIAKTGLERRQILLSVSHTHSGPWVSFSASRALNLPEHLTNDVVEYTRAFQKHLLEVGTEAMGKLKPAKLSWGTGVANFAMNRREFTPNGVILGVNPRGLVDRSVPVLRIDSPEGELRGVVFGYACHGTTLPSDSLVISGDFPGYAREVIEKKFPKAQAMFIAGLGGSANPYPRTGLNYAKQHGNELSAEVARVLGTKLRPLSGGLKCELEDAELPLEKPTRAEMEEAAKSRGKSWLRSGAQEMLRMVEQGKSIPTVHRAPVAVWQLGSELTLVALSGEVVGEYVPLIEQAIGPMNLWLAAYCNAVSGYIPTRQTLREGGYECRGLYEGAGWYAPEAETVFVGKIAELARRGGRGGRGRDGMGK